MSTPRDANVIETKIANGEVKSKPGFSSKHIEKKPQPVPDDDKKSKIQDEGKAHRDENKKAAPEKETKIVKFPLNGFVNKYHFLRVSRAVLEKLGWPKDVQIDVTLNVKDGALVVKRRNS